VGGSAYSSHLVNEVKRLRAELETMETEKRKYATSRRLIDSLVDKSNKLSSELESRSERIDKLLLNEKILKTELGKLRDHCEYLVAQNRELELGYPTESKPANVSEPPQRVDSLYKQFLFPFRGKNELEGKLKKLTDHLAKIGQKTNCGHSPILEIDRANKTVDDIRGRILDLVSASAKLEISAYCLIKNQEFVGG
jgi:DNA repair exonuclease SbcCD ATPase subunit